MVQRFPHCTPGRARLEPAHSIRRADQRDWNGAGVCHAVRQQERQRGLRVRSRARRRERSDRCRRDERRGFPDDSRRLSADVQRALGHNQPRLGWFRHALQCLRKRDGVFDVLGRGADLRSESSRLEPRGRRECPRGGRGRHRLGDRVRLHDVRELSHDSGRLRSNALDAHRERDHQRSSRNG